MPAGGPRRPASAPGCATIGAVSAFRRQGLIDAPLEAVWNLVGDPERFPDWAGDVIKVTGVATLEEGSTFNQETRTPLGTSTTQFVVEDLGDMHEIRLRCMKSGYYSHWLLTEAMGPPSPRWRSAWIRRTSATAPSMRRSGGAGTGELPMTRWSRCVSWRLARRA